MDIWIVVAYIGFLLFYGVWQGFRIKGASEFATSNKRHGLFVIFASLTASFIGGGFSTGNAAEVYRGGIGNIIGLCGFAAGQLAVGWFVLRRSTLPKNAISPGAILEPSYGKPAQVTAGAASVLLSAGILGAQIAAIGTIFNALIGVPYHIGVIIGFTVVIIYATAGGLNAILAAEMVEFGLLALGIPLLVYCAVRFAGGMENLVAALPPEHFNPLGGRTMSSLTMFFLTMAVGETLSPSFLQRMMATRDRKTITRATMLSGLAAIPVFVMTGIIGLAARASLPDIAPSAAMPEMVLRALPTGVKGVLMAAMLAIVMSSADGLLSSASIGIVNDIITPLSQRGLTDRFKLRAMRITSVLVGAAGMCYALLSTDVLAMLLLSYIAWAPIVLVPIVATLLGKRGGARQFIVAAIAGGFTAFLWSLQPAPPLGADGTIVGVIVNLVVFMAMGRMTRR